MRISKLSENDGEFTSARVTITVSVTVTVTVRRRRSE